MKYFVSILLFSIFGNVFAQKIIKSDEDIINSLEQNLSYLASDRLAGRLMGSHGEKLAYEFLIDNFQSLGLIGKGTDGSFLQAFTLNKLSFNNVSFTMSKKSFELTLGGINPTNFYPLSQSNVGKVKGKTIWLGAGNHADYVNKKSLDGKILVYKLADPNSENNKVSLENKIDTAIALGAKAVIIINQHQEVLEPDFKPFFKANFYKIPVYFLSHLNKLDTLNFDNASVELNIDTITRTLTGHNVIAFLNNKAPQTVVIGAHYDHLGYNELGGSTYRKTENEKPQIHNGADDNASGTAALIELAEIIKKAHLSKYNYLFIAFSGEEEGLLGSNYFCKHPTVDSTKINYMINMDMLGRLDSNKNTFAIDGVGTSPTWNTALAKINIDGIKPKLSESGVGASDHTSFYNIGVPVLHFFTGTHYDYHKPSDDDHLINYKGELAVLKYIYNLIYNLEEEPKLVFTKTKDTHSTTGGGAGFKVTLGIMPDYLHEGKGVKIDGVTEGKPASLAGLKRGDLLIKLGVDEVVDMQAYMKCLGKYNKGDKVKGIIVRDGNEMEVNITF
ncbi:MAG: M20/M25/M40 family metallo-hydrolase [Bacteroidia bacterium]